MYDDKWDFNEEEDNDEIIYKPKLNWMYKLLAIILIISFLALSFPWLTDLFDESYSFIQQSQELKSDTIVKNAKPAIVALQSTDSSSSTNSQGTGFIISEEGVIITNAHVVENSQSVKITFSDNEVIFSNSIEIIPDNDLAIVYVDRVDLPYLSLEKDAVVSTGDIVTIIGNPLGFNKIAQRGEVGNFYQLEDNSSPVFDIDIPINPGNSGSPVLNEAGKVVGIIFATHTITDNDVTTKSALAIPTQTILMTIDT
ncbi:MAG TPA: serine protease [Syntrophomonadaceae bacterium]|nr:serine protease [Syntrophomonadaceae bacterium]